MLEAIQRFLVPFDCWGLYEYQLADVDEGAMSLRTIDSEQKGEALLKLLDATIGTREDSVVPTDLGLALARIIEVKPACATDTRYRRLAARARSQ
jgi:hypothetical protein